MDSYGTVVELCVARNKFRKSSQQYKGVAKVTPRQARKGFTLRYNPDTHWSAALYRGLNALQFSDGKDVVNIDHNDASGFRLDMLFTHKQYSALTVEDKKYSEHIQTMSINTSLHSKQT